MKVPKKYIARAGRSSKAFVHCSMIIRFRVVVWDATKTVVFGATIRKLFGLNRSLPKNNFIGSDQIYVLYIK